jgi:hypothetical protein
LDFGKRLWYIVSREACSSSACLEESEVGVSKPWDDFMKKLVEENPQALVSFFLAGAVYEGEMNRELITRTIVEV